MRSPRFSSAARSTIPISKAWWSPCRKCACRRTCRLATAFVIPLGGKGADTLVATLERHKKFLRGEVAHRIDLRYAPELRFRLDESFDVGARIDELLRQPEVKRDLEED